MPRWNPKPPRKYLGWEDQKTVEWAEEKESSGRKLWETKWGPGTRWMKRYDKWVCSGIQRAMRKPSFRSLEWIMYDQEAETAYQGEARTRRKYGINDYIMEPLDNYHCCPCPWPITTYGEVGWLGQHDCCKLEIYPNNFMKKPPLPWYIPKISSFIPGNQ